MFKHIVQISALILFCFTFRAAYSQTSPDTITNSLQKGSLSIQFGVGDNFNINTFAGFLLACKYHFSQRTAVRLGITAEFDNFDGQRKGFTDTVFTGTNGNSYSIGVNPTFLYYFTPQKKINLFAEAGPKYIKSYAKREFTDQGTNRIETSDSWGAGILFSVGAEWFAIKQFSLFARYEMQYVYSKVYKDTKDTDLSTGNVYHAIDDYHETNFSGNTARLGISVYF